MRYGAHADWNSDYRGRGKPKEKTLFERVPKLSNIPGTVGEESLTIQDKTSTLKLTTSNRSNPQGLSRLPSHSKSQAETNTTSTVVQKQHRLMLTVTTCIAYPSQVTMEDSRSLVDDSNQLRNTARIPTIETKNANTKTQKKANTP